MEKQCIRCKRVFDVPPSQTFRQCYECFHKLRVLKNDTAGRWSMHRQCRVCEEPLGMMSNKKWARHTQKCPLCSMLNLSQERYRHDSRTGTSRCIRCGRKFKPQKDLFKKVEQCCNKDGSSPYAILRYCTYCKKRLGYIKDSDWEKHQKYCKDCYFRYESEFSKHKQAIEAVKIRRKSIRDGLTS